MISKLIILISFLFYCTLTSFSQSTNNKPDSDSLTLIKGRFFDLANKNEFDSAVPYGKKLEQLIIKENGSGSEQHAGALFYLGEVYDFLGKVREAYKCYKKSADIFDTLYPNISNLGIYAQTTARVGYMCLEFGATEEEKFYFGKAIHIYNKIPGDIALENVQQIYIVLGNIYMYQGEYQKADSIYSSIKAKLDSLPPNGFNLYLKGAIYASKATIYSETGNNIKCIEYIRKALPLEVEAKDSGYIDNDYIKISLNLAEAYALNNDMDNAWKACKQAADSLNNLNHDFLSAQIIKQKAFLYQQSNNYERAIELTKIFLSMADTLPEVKNNDDYYFTIVNWGVLYTAIKKYTSADSLFRKVITVLQDSGLIYSYAMIQAKKGLCINLIKEKRYEEATDSLLALINIDFEAMNKNFSGMSESEKLSYQSEADKVFDLLYICLHEEKSIQPNTIIDIYRLELERKGFVLRNKLDELNTVRNSKDTTLINLYNEWLNSSEIFARQNALPYNQRIFKTDSLEEINNNLEKKIAAISAEISIANENVLPESLKPNAATANIEFVRYDYKSLSAGKDSGFYAAFITSASDTFPHFIELCSEQQLINLMKDKTGKWINENQLTQNIYNKQSKNSSILCHLIWQKINEHLAGIKVINYSTAGLLNNISFPAIYNGTGYLINHYNFNRYFSLQQSFTSAAGTKMQNEINIWGNINYNLADYKNDLSTQNITAHQATSSSTEENFTLGSTVKGISDEPLQSFNTDEVQHLKKLFADNAVTTYTIENSVATEDNFKQQSSSFSGILHISTHGFYTPYNESRIKSSLPSSYISGNANPLFRCGLVFAGVNYYWVRGRLKANHDDGILTGYEISRLDLHNVQLVTLSACETGLGDITNNEGDIGLQRAFKIAGVKTMLVSLWQVPAKQTSQLLTLFYKNWLQGQLLDEAFRQAELTMQKQYPPYFWAGFVLIK